MAKALTTVLFLGITFASFLRANAATVPHSFIGGNALVAPHTMEKVVKALIASSLNASLGGDGLKFSVPSAEYSITIPQKPMLKAITHSLGLDNKVEISFDPIEARFDFTPNQLQITVTKLSTNEFRIQAHWEVNVLKAKSRAFRLHVPKGVFDEAFVITSSPVMIGLKETSPAISADLSLKTILTNDGAHVSLESLKTNIDQSPTLEMKLGPVTLNGVPLELEIISNGQRIKTTEAQIRSQFNSFGPELMSKIQQQLAQVVQTQFQKIAEKMSNEEALKIAIKSDDILKKIPAPNEAVKTLLSGINATFSFSYLQNLSIQKLFTAQISSNICLDQTCLKQEWGNSRITTRDLQAVIGEDAGAIIYESWAQNVINSPEYQKRIRAYYNKSLASPGVVLGKNGVKIHFNYRKNAIVAVLNLNIHIPSTVKSNSSIGERMRKQFGGTWEYLFGTHDRIVQIPIEITGKLNGVERDPDGKKVLVITTQLPFRSDHTLQREYMQYPSNVENMTKMVKGDLLESVEEELRKAIPEAIRVPLKTINIKGLEMNINRALITENKGLLLSGCVQ